MTEIPSTAASRALVGGRWLADTQQSSVEFFARHLGLIPVCGTIPIVNGVVTVDPETNRAKASFVLDPAGFDTRNAKRDDHVRSADFLDTARYPSIAFRSVDLRFDRANPAGFTLDGSLTVRGTTLLVALAVRFAEPSVAEEDWETVRLTASASVDRSQFGVTKLPFIVGERIRLRISLTLRKSAEGHSE